MDQSKFSLGLVSVSFRDRTPREILEAMKCAGLSVVEWGSDVHAPYTDTERITEIAGLQKEYGIKCSSYGTYFRLGEAPIEELIGYIHAAKILGTHILRLWCGSKNGQETTFRERDELLSLARESAKIAQKNGVTLCMECHQRTFTENPDDAVWLLKAVNSPYFRMYWQPFQWQNPEENCMNAQKIAPYTEHIHVFNWRDSDRFPLSLAADQWKQYLRYFPAPRTLLLEFMPNNSLEELAAEASALKMIVEGYSETHTQKSE